MCLASRVASIHKCFASHFSFNALRILHASLTNYNLHCIVVIAFNMRTVYVTGLGMCFVKSEGLIKRETRSLLSTML